MAVYCSLMRAVKTTWIDDETVLTEYQMIDKKTGDLVPGSSVTIRQPAWHFAHVGDVFEMKIHEERVDREDPRHPEYANSKEVEF